MKHTKMPINLIYSADLCRELMPHPRLLTTKQNISLKMTRPNMMVAYINLNKDESKGYVAMLRTDEITLDNFIEEHQITDLAKLDKIDPGLLWIKYLAGKAEVRFEVPDMALKKIWFRVVDGCTMVYNYDRHFCDRIPQVLSMLKHFEYFRNRYYLLDTNLNLKHAGKTIDTVSSIDVRKKMVDEGGGKGKIIPGKARVKVNKDSFMDGAYLYVVSALRADNENRSDFNAYSVIDRYRLADGKYSSSFYIDKIKEKPFKSAMVSGDTLFTLYNGKMVLYRLPK